jgi:hypothetical protein
VPTRSAKISNLAVLTFAHNSQVFKPHFWSDGEALSKIVRALPAGSNPHGEAMSKREKLFTDGRQTPIDRNDRARMMFLADAAWRKGEITSAAVDILRALLFQFANLKDGRCFPSHERLGELAGCCARTCGRCLKALEAVRLVTWAHRLLRVAEPAAGLPGLWVTTWRVIRTSNSYDFPLIAKNPGIPTDGQNVRGSAGGIFVSSLAPAAPLAIDGSTELGASILRLEAARSAYGAKATEKEGKGDRT